MRDVLEAIAYEIGRPITSIKADGGTSANGFLMQSLINILGVSVRVAMVREATALGAAFMAGLGSGVWRHQEEIAALWREAQCYQPRSGAEAEALYTQWRRAVERTKEWVTPVNSQSMTNT
jgi:glycerol kinase